jgi:ATP-dependent DNA helicase RecG
MDENELKSLLKEKESVELEFKADSPDTKTLAKLMSAFANTRGGKIILGVADDGMIVGINDIAYAQRSFIRAR